LAYILILICFGKFKCMNYRELNSRYRQIFEFIAKNRIKDTFDTLAVLCNSSRNRDFRSQLEGHAETYLNMLKYAFELSDDPQKENVYNRLVKDIIELADDVREDIIRSNNLLHYYNQRIIPESLTDQLITEASKMIDRIMLQKESESKGTEVNEIESIYKTSDYKGTVKSIFQIIWHADKLRDIEINLIEKLIRKDTFAWYDKCIIVSALSLSLIRHFDSKKIDLLFNFYEAAEKQVWQRALVGLVLGLTYYDQRIIYYPEILQRLKAIQGMKKANNSIEIIIQQYIKARETEKIARKIQQEIIPEMIRIKSRLEEKLDLENLLSSINPEDKNPEWETFFKDSPDVYSKLEEFTNLQMEGADVFLSAFAMLKQYDFFNEVNNWFLPFYKENDFISATFDGFSEGLDLKQFGEGIERSNFLCNSDKYSFCLNIRNLQALQKSTVMELFNMELKAMNEMAVDDELINSDANLKVIFTQYFQDLYRFYKLHPLRNEFEDMFNLPTAIYETVFFKEWVDDTSVLRNIGEFFFQKNYYRDALLIFERLVIIKNNHELFEKIAYCYQQLGEFDQALDYYHKAELLDKNKLWLINRIAWCYRKKGEYETAVKYYLEAEKLEPEDLQIQAFLGHVYMEMENFEKALQYYFKVEYLQPENHKVQRPISWCSFMLGRLDNAIKYLEKSILHNVNKHDFMNLGHIYWCKGDKQKAIQNYRLSLKTSGQDVDWFSRVMHDDSKYLAKYHIHAIDIPLMIDYIRLSVTP
jgi:tetratricopeptide (TPR) repeat protein